MILFADAADATTDAAANAAANAAALNAAWIALAAGVAGVVLTVVAGFIGAWIQGRREHTKWVKEKRYEAYVEVWALNHMLTNNRRALRSAQAKGDQAGVDRYSARLDDLNATFERAGAPLNVLGPEEVTAAALKMLDASNGDDRTEKRDSALALVAAMRKVLDIEG
ncbi:hypothetical protein [Microbacterium sp. P5_E9]